MAHSLGNPGSAGLTFSDEEALTALLRPRVEAAARQQGGTWVWTRPERSAERDDHRARTGLDRAASDRLPSGRPWRGTCRGRIFRRVRWGAAIVVANSWQGMAQGNGGAMTLAEAVACAEREKEHWRRQFGEKSLYVVVAGAFREPIAGSPREDVALLSWQDGAWHFRGSEGRPELSDLFFPRAAEKTPPPARWRGMSTFCQRLLSPFQGHHRRAQTRLEARSAQFQAAKREADRLREACERHAAAGDWSPEMLQLQRAHAAEAARQAQLLHRQVAALQQNVQVLTTARMGGDLIADAKLPIAAEKFEELDRAHYEAQMRREAVVRTERALSATLLADEAALPELPQGPERATERLLES